jgi:Peptidase family M23
MPYRTARRLLPFACLLVFAGAASATPKKGVPQLIFPVVGDTQYIDDFGAPRAGGPHEGNDLMAEKKSPAVAAEAGKVKFWTTSAAAGCMLYLYGDSGTTYLYIHLNNDLTMKNDNRGKCAAGTSYAPGLKNGARVAAGQLVGFVGDSGDANGIHAHLHFEVHPNDGRAVDPFPYLRNATHLLFSSKPSATVSLVLNAKIVANAGGLLDMKLSKLQVLPSKQTLTVNRRLVVGTATDLQIELSDVLPSMAKLVLSDVKAGFPVTVYTAPAKATIEAQRGDDDVFVASRIVVGGSTR